MRGTVPLWAILSRQNAARLIASYQRSALGTDVAITRFEHEIYDSGDDHEEHEQASEARVRAFLFDRRTLVSTPRIRADNVRPRSPWRVGNSM